MWLKGPFIDEGWKDVWSRWTQRPLRGTARDHYCPSPGPSAPLDPFYSRPREAVLPPVVSLPFLVLLATTFLCFRILSDPFTEIRAIP